jgi:hypothetical protein
VKPPAVIKKEEDVTEDGHQRPPGKIDEKSNWEQLATREENNDQATYLPDEITSTKDFLPPARPFDTDTSVKVELKLRLFSLGPGRMAPQDISVSFQPDARLPDVLSIIAKQYEIVDPAFTYPCHFQLRNCPISYAVNDDIASVIENLDDGALSMWRCKNSPQYDLYADPLIRCSPIVQRSGFEALLFAALFVECDRFKELLPQFDAQVDYVEESSHFSSLSDILAMLCVGGTPVGIHNPQGCYQIVKWLTAHPNMNLDRFPNVGTRTPAQEAARHGMSDILRLLLQSGASTTGLFDQLKAIKDRDVYVKMLEVIAEHVSGGEQPCEPT